MDCLTRFNIPRHGQQHRPARRTEARSDAVLVCDEFQKTKIAICGNKHSSVRLNEGKGLYPADSLWEDFPGLYSAALLQDTDPLNKYDQLYKLSLIAYMFEAEPKHLLVHVTKLTPLLICNCPQPSEIQHWTQGEKRKAVHAVYIPKLHSCLHS